MEALLIIEIILFVYGLYIINKIKKELKRIDDVIKIQSKLIFKMGDKND